MIPSSASIHIQAFQATHTFGIIASGPMTSNSDLLSAIGAAGSPSAATGQGKSEDETTLDGILKAAAQGHERECGGITPTCEIVLPLQVSSPAKTVVGTTGDGNGSKVVATEALGFGTVAPTSGGDSRNEHGARATDLGVVDSQTKSDTLPQHEKNIGDGCQSSVERNIWSVFNPMWSTFVVNKPRLPKASDREADWSGTAGRPGELKEFMGLKNPVNRK